jgi:hypothetical protein
VVGFSNIEIKVVGFSKMPFIETCGRPICCVFARDDCCMPYWPKADAARSMDIMHSLLNQSLGDNSNHI